jgi:prepilin-type N-terminal cleavage/methylation domain-containing protein
MIKPSSYRRGFTLVELLVVIAIILVLAAISFQIMGKMRRNADQTVVIGNMRQLGLAMASFTSDKGRYPGVNTDPVWDRAIIPYLGYNEELPGTKTSFIKPSEAPNLAAIAKIFASPADKEGSFTDLYRRSFAIIPWTTNLQVGNTIMGWADLPTGEGVRPAMINAPEKAAVIVQWYTNSSTVANRLGSGGHQHHGVGGPVEQLDNPKQFVLFADGHVAGVPATMSASDFRDEYWPGKYETAN